MSIALASSIGMAPVSATTLADQIADRIIDAIAARRIEPGQRLTLTATAAPTPAAAAHYYPAIYWYAMMKIPPAGDFGGKSEIPEKLTRTDWLKQMKNIGCIGCHQLGQEATRTIPAAFGKFDSGAAAWMRRVQSGQSGEQITNQLAGNFGGVPFKYFGDWTDRLAKGVLKPGANTTIDAGRIGKVEIKDNNVLLGTPVTFTKDNIDKFDF